MSKSVAKKELYRALIPTLFRKLGVKSLTKAKWKRTKEFFNDECAYCGTPADKVLGPLTKEHLVGLNKTELGTDHVSNVVPAHKQCQNRDKVRTQGGSGRKQDNWKNHIRHKWEENQKERINKIEEFIEIHEKIPGLGAKRKKVRAILSESDAGFDIFWNGVVSKLSGNGGND